MKNIIKAKTCRCSIIAIGVALAMGSPHYAAAQDAGQSDPAAAEDGLEDSNRIIVTARKREELLQDVPLAIQVVTGDEVVNQGVADLRDLTKLTPSVTFDRGIQPNDFRVAIRGLQAEAGRTSVGLLIDGIDLTSENVGNPGGGFLANPRLLDIERVEVVKGPQSALYGRSAFGGAINYVSKRQDLSSYDLSLSGEVHSEEGYLLRGAVGAPLIDGVLGIRVNGYHFDERGSYRNEISSDFIGGSEGYGIGGSANFVPSDEFSLFVVAQYSDDQYAPPPIFVTPANETVTLSANQTAVLGVATANIFRGSLEPQAVSFDTDIDGEDFAGTDSETFRVAAVADVELDGITISWLSSYVENDAEFRQDNDFQGTLPTELRVSPFQDTDKQTETSQLSQEIRIQSNTGGPLSWTIGGLFWEEEVTLSEQNNTAVPFAPISNADFNAYFATVNARPRRTFGRDTTHYSAFAFVEYEISDTLSVSAEGRYATEDIEYFLDQQNYTFLDFILPGAVDGQPFIGTLAAVDEVDQASVSESYFIPRVAISYQPQDNINLYASVGTGVKPGGFGTGNVVTFDDGVGYDREELIAYEIGAKTSWFDDDLILNVAGFYQDYTDQQVRSLIFNETFQTLQPVTENAGETRIWGVEFEALAKPAAGLTLSLNYTYLNAEFTDFTVLSNSAVRVAELADCGLVTLPDNSITCELDRAGLTPPDLPTHRLIVRGEYITPLTDSLDLFVDGIMSHKSRTFADTSNVLIQPSRTVVDASIGVSSDKFRVAVFAENLFDDRTITDGNLYLDFSQNFGPAASGFLADPFKVGLRVSLTM